MSSHCQLVELSIHVPNDYDDDSISLRFRVFPFPSQLLRNQRKSQVIGSARRDDTIQAEARPFQTLNNRARYQFIGNQFHFSKSFGNENMVEVILELID